MNSKRKFRNLEIYIDDEEKQELRQLVDDKGDNDETMYEFLEPLISNSDLDWISSQETGDLTHAPMLGIKDEYQNVTERWAFMQYETKSPLQDLLIENKCVFIS